MDNLFDLDLTSDVSMGIKTVYDPAKLERIQESICDGVYKGFKIFAKDEYCGHWGHAYRWFCVFPTFIVSSFQQGVSAGFCEIDTHTLGPIGLKCLKLAKVCYHKDDSISKLISRFQFQDEERLVFEQEQYRLKGLKEREVFEYKREAFERERKAFEYERQSFESFKSRRDELRRKYLEIEESRQAFEKEKVAQELRVVRQAFELEESRQALERDRQTFEHERQTLERELAKYKGIVGDCLKEIEAYLE